MTLHVIPWMWGVEGNKTCGISDTIYITESGCESFFTLDRDFVVKPDQANKTVTRINSHPKKAKTADTGESGETKETKPDNQTSSQE
jgi:Xaa-Pro dipeptidase